MRFRKKKKKVSPGRKEYLVGRFIGTNRKKRERANRELRKIWVWRRQGETMRDRVSVWVWGGAKEHCVVEGE